MDGTSTVEQSLWRALTIYRVLALAYAVTRYALDFGHYAHPAGGWIYIAVLIAWNAWTTEAFRRGTGRTHPVLTADLVLALAGVLLTRYLDSGADIAAGAITLPTIWSSSPVLGFAILGGWRPGALAALVTGACDIAERGSVTEGNIHNLVILLLAGFAIGYVADLAKQSERALHRALRVEAATRERDRLAREIHDSVLQSLAMVRRRGNDLGGDAADLGRLAGEQETALRALFATVPAPRPATDVDLRAELRPLTTPRVTLSAPAEPVTLPPHTAAELTAAVRAALDNVTRHVGADARAWILVEEEDDDILVTIRDEGPGIPAGRLAEAAAQGRIGIAGSIRGRLAELGGHAAISTGPGTEIELRVPRKESR